MSRAFFLGCASGLGATGDRAARPLWAALGLAVSPRLLMFARRIFIDIYISMFMALTLLFFALAERYPGRRRLFLTLMYVSRRPRRADQGSGAFALLPAWCSRSTSSCTASCGAAAMMLPAGVLIVSRSSLPWYAALYQRDGWTYIRVLLRREPRALHRGARRERDERPVCSTCRSCSAMRFRWSRVSGRGGAGVVADRRLAGRSTDPAFRVRTLLWLWIVTIVGFFTLSAAKQDLYIFPIVPAVAALAGIAIARAVERPEHVTAVRRTTIGAGLVLLVLAGGLLYLFAGAGARVAVRARC